MKQLNDFASLIQLLTAFNFAFVAVKGSNSFSMILYEYFFQIDKRVKDKHNELSQSIEAERETINSISHKSESEKIELISSYDRLVESKNKSLESALNRAKSELSDSYSGNLFLFIGLYGLMLLVFCGLNRYTQLTPYWQIFNSAILIYICGYFFVEAKIIKSNGLISITSTLIAFALITVASFVAGFTNHYITKDGIIWLEQDLFDIFHVGSSIVALLSSFMIYFGLVARWSNSNETIDNIISECFISTNNVHREYLEIKRRLVDETLELITDEDLVG